MCADIGERAAHLSDVLASSPCLLPEHPDVDAVSAWSTVEHLRYGQEHGLLG